MMLCRIPDRVMPRTCAFDEQCPRLSDWYNTRVRLLQHGWLVYAAASHVLSHCFLIVAYQMYWDISGNFAKKANLIQLQLGKFCGVYFNTQHFLSKITGRGAFLIKQQSLYGLQQLFIFTSDNLFPFPLPRKCHECYNQ